jgi:biopolymer transport protein ExbD
MQFRRRLQQRANVELIPMIDVVFQLVVFFMLTSTFVMTPGIPMELPQAASAEEVAVNRLVVSVVSEDEIYLNQDEYTLTSLSDALTELAAQSEEGAQGVRSVVVEADRSISYDLVIRVLDQLRANGFRAVSLRTAPNQE